MLTGPTREQEITSAMELSLESPELRLMDERLRTLGIGDTQAPGVLDPVRAAGRDPGITALKKRLSLGDDDVTLERWLLLQSMKRNLTRVPSLPVPDAVKQLLWDEFAFMSAPDAGSLRHFRYHAPRFATMARQVLLRRFPAGLFNFEESGVSRRWLLRMPWRDLMSVLRMTATAFGGFDSMLVPHLNARRKSPWLTETAANRSYYLMAETLETQPHLRGIAGSSWFRSPTIVEVAPHLAWVNRVFLENGGFITTVGPADENSGVFFKCPRRRAMYEAGTFRPLLGLALWPRDAVLAWKRAHPEFAPRPRFV
jgi:hypothetical protein